MSHFTAEYPVGFEDAAPLDSESQMQAVYQEQEQPQAFEYTHADGTVYAAEDRQTAIKMCPVLGKMATEDALLLVEIAALGQQQLDQSHNKSRTKPIDQIHPSEPNKVQDTEPNVPHTIPEQRTYKANDMAFELPIDSTAQMTVEHPSELHLPPLNISLEYEDQDIIPGHTSTSMNDHFVDHAQTELGSTPATDTVNQQNILQYTQSAKLDEAYRHAHAQLAEVPPTYVKDIEPDARVNSSLIAITTAESLTEAPIEPYFVDVDSSAADPMYATTQPSVSAYPSSPAINDMEELIDADTIKVSHVTNQPDMQYVAYEPEPTEQPVEAIIPLPIEANEPLTVSFESVNKDIEETFVVVLEQIIAETLPVALKLPEQDTATDTAPIAITLRELLLQADDMESTQLRDTAVQVIHLIHNSMVEPDESKAAVCLESAENLLLELCKLSGVDCQPQTARHLVTILASHISASATSAGHSEYVANLYRDGTHEAKRSILHVLNSTALTLETHGLRRVGEYALLSYAA